MLPIQIGHHWRDSADRCSLCSVCSMVDPHLTAANGYHVLLAGMEWVSVDLGQFVVTGEPVVVMGDGSAVAKAGGAKPSSARTGAPSIQAHGGRKRRPEVPG